MAAEHLRCSAAEQKDHARVIVSHENTNGNTGIAAIPQALLARGYRPVEIEPGTKRSRHKDWPTIARNATAESLASFTSPSVGILCEVVIGVDIDCPDAAMVEDIEQIARRIFGRTPLRRVGQPPKLLLLYQAADPQQRWVGTPRLLLNGRPCQVEIRAHGQQSLAFGIHPDTGQPYKWLDGSPLQIAAEELPIVTPEQLAAFLAEAEAIIRRYGAAGDSTGTHTAVVAAAAKHAADLAPPDAAAVVALLDRLPNPEDTDRETYISVMLAAQGCITGLDAIGRLGDFDADAIRDAAVRWAARWPFTPGEDVEAEKWDSDISTRDRPLAGWSNLQQHAVRWIPDYGLETAAEDFPALPPEPDQPDIVKLPEMSEDAAALEFARRYHQQFRFDHTERRWLRFEPGNGWTADDDGGVSRAARHFVRAARRQWGDLDESRAAGKIAFSTAVTRGAETDSRMATTHEAWDADPMAIGTPGGSVDLRTGGFRLAKPADLIVRRVTVAAAVEGTPAPRWQTFLADATGGDGALQEWLQRFCGYALTGDASEEIMAFLYGPGGNGKGVFVHTVSAILGTYAYQAPAELFRADSRLNREYQLARLDGMRLLIASETEAGCALAESFVKELTGNEGLINARHPYGRPFEFRPRAKLLIVGNHAPQLRGRSEAMERRLRVVPFNRRPAQPDPNLKDALRAEYPAILRWMIDGCLAWQRDRLGRCPAVAAASAAYFAEQDSISQWVADECAMDPTARGQSGRMLESFNTWMRPRGERQVDAKTFKEMLSRVPGITWRHTRTGKVFDGICLRSEFTEGGTGDVLNGVAT